MGLIIRNKVEYGNIPFTVTIGGGGGFAPVGTIITCIGVTAPQDFLPCDGTEFFIQDFPQLSEYIKRQFGSYNYFGGNGTTTFAVPDVQPTHEDVMYCIKAIVTGEGFTLHEHLVGEWIDHKPLYQITIQGTTINANEGTIATGLHNIDYCELKSFQVSNGTYRRNLLDSVGIKEDGSQIAMVRDSESTFKNKPFTATILYTKTTDVVTNLGV
jgi:microcystin-dependent protein